MDRNGPATASTHEQRIRAHLEQVLASTALAGSERLRRLLQFLVESALSGRSIDVKEYTIGIEVFDRRPAYDTRTDSTVRVHIGKLRDRLDHYYLTEGRESAVRIELPRGTYIPEFRFIHESPPPPRRTRRSAYGWVAAGVVVAAAMLVFGLRSRPAQPRFQQLTFRRGPVTAARFLADGSVLYSAAWEGQPSAIYVARPDQPDSRPFGAPPGSHLLAVSASTGQVAVALRATVREMPWVGTLAITNLAGAAPREVLDEVSDADFSADGRSLAVIHWVGGHTRIEFPIGHVIYDPAPPVWLSHLRIAPGGDRIAFLEHRTTLGDDEGWVSMVDLHGRKTDLAGRWISASGLAWAPSGREMWFTASESGMNAVPRAVTLSGKSRVLRSMPGRYTLHDAAADGRVLLTQDTGRVRLMYGARGAGERELSWFDGTFFRGMSSDGSTLLFDEEGEAGRTAAGIYTRSSDGSAAVRLGDGWAIALSPDAKWVLGRWRQADPPRLVVFPVGPGESRQLEPGGIDFREEGTWFPDNRHFLAVGNTRGRPVRCWRVDRLGGAPEPVTPEGIAGQVLSPDGAYVLAHDAAMQWSYWPVSGGAARPMTVLRPGDAPLRWGGDGAYLFVRRGAGPVQIDRIRIRDGYRETWQLLRPSDPAGITEMYGAGVSADGERYAYCFMRVFSDLFVADRLE